MCCWECRFEFDELNESQSVCPGCGRPPSSQRDQPDFSGVFEDAHAASLIRASEAEPDDTLDTTPALESVPFPVDLQEAADDAEALLEAIGMTAFHLPDGLRFFRLQTGRVM